jgi:diamine N-acetyltransferase
MIGKKVKLRAIEPSDIDLLYQWENDISTWHLSSTVAPFSKFLLEEYVANAHLDIYTTKQLRLMIENISVNKTVGCIDLFDFDPLNNRAGIGILICNEERNKGFAAEALELLIKYCFNTLLLNQVYCNIISDNVNSLNLFKKFNFEIIGLKKKWIRTNGLWADEYMLQLIHSL